jgi:nucleolin
MPTTKLARPTFTLAIAGSILALALAPTSAQAQKSRGPKALRSPAPSASYRARAGLFDTQGTGFDSKIGAAKGRARRPSFAGQRSGQYQNRSLPAAGGSGGSRGRGGYGGGMRGGMGRGGFGGGRR